MVFAICEADGTSLLEEYSCTLLIYYHISSFIDCTSRSSLNVDALFVAVNFAYQSADSVTMEISKAGTKASKTLNACGNDVTPAQMK